MHVCAASATRQYKEDVAVITCFTNCLSSLEGMPARLWPSMLCSAHCSNTHGVTHARTRTRTRAHTHSCIGISACHYVRKITEHKASLTPIRPAASTSPPATQPVILMTFSSLSRLKNRVTCHMSHNPMTNEVTCRTSHNPSHRALVQAPRDTTHVSLQVYAYGCAVAVSGSDLMAGADCR